MNESIPSKTQLKKNITKMYVAKFLSTLEFTCAIYVLFLLANEFSMTEVMLLQSFYTLLVFILEIPSGAFADLIGKKQSLIIGQVVSVITFLIYGFANNLILFFVAETFWAIGAALKSGSDSALVYDTLKGLNQTDKFKKIMGRVSALTMIAWGIATMAGGIVASFIGYRPLFFMTAAICSSGIFVYASIVEPKKSKSENQENYLDILKSGIKFSVKHVEVRKYLLYVSYYGNIGYIIYMFLQPFMNYHELPISIIGFGMTGFFVFNSLGHFFADKVSKYFKNDDKLLLIIMPISALLIIGTGFFNVWISLIAIYIIIFMSALKDELTDNTIHNHASSAHRATVISVKNMIKSCVYSLIVPFLGILADKYSVKIPLFVYGLVLLPFWILNVYYFSRTKKKYDKFKEDKEFVSEETSLPF